MKNLTFIDRVKLASRRPEVIQHFNHTLNEILKHAGYGNGAKLLALSCIEKLLSTNSIRKASRETSMSLSAIKVDSERTILNVLDAVEQHEKFELLEAALAIVGKSPRIACIGNGIHSLYPFRANAGRREIIGYNLRKFPDVYVVGGDLQYHNGARDIFKTRIKFDSAIIVEISQRGLARRLPFELFKVMNDGGKVVVVEPEPSIKTETTQLSSDFMNFVWNKILTSRTNPCTCSCRTDETWVHQYERAGFRRENYGSRQTNPRSLCTNHFTGREWRALVLRK